MSYWGRVIGLGCMAIFCAACSTGGGDGDIDPPPTVYKSYLYVSGGGNPQIYSIDVATGALTQVASPQLTGCNSDCVAIHPSGKFLISGDFVSHQFTVFAIDAATGSLTRMDGSPCDVSGGPRAIALINSGGIMVVANFAYSAPVSVCTINPSTGRITEVYEYIEYAGSIFGARSIAVLPSEKFFYVAGEGLSTRVEGMIQGFAVINAEIGEMTPLHDLPYLTAGNEASSVTIDPSGKHLYLANGGLDTVSVFDVDATTGALTEIPGSPFGTLGDRPMCVAVDPTGKFAYVANAGSDTVSVFTIDAATGALTPLVPSPTYPTGSFPCSIAFDPSGKFIYVGNKNIAITGDKIIISEFSMDPETGALTALAGAPHGYSKAIYMAAIRVAYKGS